MNESPSTMNVKHPAATKFFNWLSRQLGPSYTRNQLDKNLYRINSPPQLSHNVNKSISTSHKRHHVSGNSSRCHGHPRMQNAQKRQ